MKLTFANDDKSAIPLVPVSKELFADWQRGLEKVERNWAKCSKFDAGIGEVLVFPTEDGKIAKVAAGIGDAQARTRGRFHMAAARNKIPTGTYRLHSNLTTQELEETALGWLLSGYCFDRYAKVAAPSAELIVPEGVDADRIETIAAGEALTRNLINTPAFDLGPLELAEAAAGVARNAGVETKITEGDQLLSAGFPMIHTVGRGSVRQPRLVDFSWGHLGPSLTLVGKGVCFDTGGLNIKPGASMGLMKKDMGGAAAVLGLAQMIMALKLPIRLRVLIPAVENSIGGDAYRPSDILKSRKGLTVEINNTDAEGRLVLADALAFADESHPDLIVSMATLTGAARVAVGPDIAPFFATQSKDAFAISNAAERVNDPVWRLPFWDPYEPMIEPGIADLDNAPAGGMAGAITAALFLRRFVTETPRYMHFDIYGWQPTSKPARPKGGVGQATRAILDALPELMGL